MENLTHGQKVKYEYNGQTLHGTIHGIRTYEDSSGIITDMTYLIDTGKVIREDVTKVHPKTGQVLETVTQPEQVEVRREFVRPL